MSENSSDDDRLEDEEGVDFRHELDALSKEIDKYRKLYKLEDGLIIEKEKIKIDKHTLFENISRDLDELNKNNDEKERNNQDITSDLALYPLLNVVNSLNKDIRYKNAFNKYDKKLKYEIKESENFMLLKHMGHLFDGLGELLKIDDITFNLYQSEMTKIYDKIEFHGIDLDSQISSIITINIYIRYSQYDFKEQELHNKEISLQNLEGIKMSYLDYDERFNITKKYTVGELKFKACGSFNILAEDYIIISKNFEWVPYSLDIYEEIKNKNIEKGYIESTSRFFLMKPYVNEQFCLIFINKECFKNRLYKDTMSFPIIKDNQSENTYNVRMKIHNGFEDIKYEYKRKEILKKIDPYSALTIEDLIKNKILAIIRLLYDNNLNLKKDSFLNLRDDFNEMNGRNKKIGYDDVSEDSKRRKYLIDNEEEINLDNSLNVSNVKKSQDKKSRKKKHAKKFGGEIFEIELEEKPKRREDQKDYHVISKNFVAIEDLKIKSEILTEITSEHKDILMEFDGKITNFILKCDEFIGGNQRRNQGMQLIKNEKKEIQKGKESDFIQDQEYEEGIDGLSTFLFNFIKHKGSLCHDPAYFQIFYQRNTNLIIENIIEDFIRDESEYITKLKDDYVENKLNKKNQKKLNLASHDEDNKSLKTIIQMDCFLKFLEVITILVLVFLSYRTVNNTAVEIQTLSNFNTKVFSTFDESNSCNNDFRQMTSPSDMNSWMRDCYYGTLNNYLMTYAELDKSPIYSIFIFYSDIQMKYQGKKNCSNKFYNYLNDSESYGSELKRYTSFGISYLNDSLPKCIDGEQKNLYEMKKNFFDSSGLTPPHSDLEFTPFNIFDTLFYTPSRVDQSSTIQIYTKDNLTSLNGINTINSVINKEESNKDNEYIKSIDNMIKFKSYDPKSTISFSNLANQTETITEVLSTDMFIDTNVTDITFSTYFINQDIDKLGLIIHKFNSKSSLVNSEISYYSMEIENLDSSGTTFINNLYLTCMLMLIIFCYFKYAQKEDLIDTISRSFFLFLIEGIYFFENIYKFYHILQGTNDSFFKPSLVYNVEKRDRYIYYRENIKFFKGTLVLTLFFHLIYALFSLKDLTIIRKLFKRVIIVFFIVIAFLILSLTIFININYGIQNDDYSQIFTTFYSFFAFILGVEVTQENDKEKRDDSNIRYSLKIIVYLIRLVVINFSLIVMILTFQRFKEKEEEKEDEDSDEEDADLEEYK